MPSPITHFQILARNPERAADFYSRLFGWTISAENAMSYRQIETGGIPGGIWPAPPEGHGMVQFFVGVPDVATALGAAEAAGGKTLMPLQHLPDGDEMAILLDPEGIPFGLVRAPVAG